jgi:hypothetical protein
MLWGRCCLQILWELLLPFSFVTCFLAERYLVSVASHRGHKKDWRTEVERKRAACDPQIKYNSSLPTANSRKHFRSFQLPIHLHLLHSCGLLYRSSYLKYELLRDHLHIYHQCKFRLHLVRWQH